MHKTRTVTAAVAKFFLDIVLLQFRGGGLDDLTIGGTYTGYRTQMVLIRISTAAGTDKFQYSIDGGVNWSAEITMTGGADAVVDGITATWSATTGHTLYDEWVVVGDCIDHSNITTGSAEEFTGSGLDDLTVSGNYHAYNYKSVIVMVSTAAATDKFKYSWDDGASYSDEIAMTGAAQHIGYGVLVTFSATTGHTEDEYWTIPCIPAIEYLKITDILVEVDTAEANDEIMFQDEDGNDEFCNIPIATAGLYTVHFGNPPRLKPGKDVKIATTGSSFSAEVTLTANVILL